MFDPRTKLEEINRKLDNIKNFNGTKAIDVQEINSILNKIRGREEKRAQLSAQDNELAGECIFAVKTQFLRLGVVIVNGIEYTHWDKYLESTNFFSATSEPGRCAVAMDLIFFAQFRKILREKGYGECLLPTKASVHARQFRLQKLYEFSSEIPKIHYEQLCSDWKILIENNKCSDSFGIDRISGSTIKSYFQGKVGLHTNSSSTTPPKPQNSTATSPILPIRKTTLLLSQKQNQNTGNDKSSSNKSTTSDSVDSDDGDDNSRTARRISGPVKSRNLHANSIRNKKRKLSKSNNNDHRLSKSLKTNLDEVTRQSDDDSFLSEDESYENDDNEIARQLTMTMTDKEHLKNTNQSSRNSSSSSNNKLEPFYKFESTTPHNHDNFCYSGSNHSCVFDSDLFTNSLGITRRSNSKGTTAEVFRETDLFSFENILDTLLEIVQQQNEEQRCSKKFLDFGAGNFLLCCYIASKFNFQEVAGTEIQESLCGEGRTLALYLQKKGFFSASSLNFFKTQDDVNDVHNWLEKYDIIYSHNIRFNEITNSAIWNSFLDSSLSQQQKVLIVTKKLISTVTRRGSNDSSSSSDKVMLCFSLKNTYGDNQIPLYAYLSKKHAFNELPSKIGKYGLVINNGDKQPPRYFDSAPPNSKELSDFFLNDYILIMDKYIAPYNICVRFVSDSAFNKIQNKEAPEHELIQIGMNYGLSDDQQWKELDFIIFVVFVKKQHRHFFLVLVYFDKTKKSNESSEETPYFFYLDSFVTEFIDWNQQIIKQFGTVITGMNHKGIKTLNLSEAPPVLKINVEEQMGSDCGYAVITNMQILINTGFVNKLKGKNIARELNSSNSIKELDISLGNYGYITTNKILLRTLLFKILKKGNYDNENLVISSKVTLWPRYIQSLFFLAPVIIQ